MTSTRQHEAIVDMLLNTLEAERYVRGALLFNLLDELSAVDALEPAAVVVRDLMVELESGPLDQAEFAIRIADIRALVRSLAPRTSGLVPADPTRGVRSASTSKSAA